MPPHRMLMMRSVRPLSWLITGRDGEMKRDGLLTEFVIQIDDTGKIEDVLTGTGGFHLFKTGISLLGLIEKSSIEKFLDFLLDLKEKGASFCEQIVILFEDNPMAFHLVGIKEGEGYLMIGSSRYDLLVHRLSEMEKRESEDPMTHLTGDGQTLSNPPHEMASHCKVTPCCHRYVAIRDQILHALLPYEQGENLYTEISTLNNELVNMQRELAKKNAELIRLNEQLTHAQDLLTESNKNLKKKAEDLEIMNRQLEEFTYIVSHDLQAPIRGIAGNVELLQSKYGETLDEKANAYITKAIKGSQKIREMIRSLLAYSRATTQQGDFSFVSTEEILIELIEDMDFLIKRRHGEITHDSLPEIYGDPSQIMMLFQNLLQNAIKYRREEISLKIHVSASQRGDEWVFSVKDNGIGIDAADVEEIFRVFYRGGRVGETSGNGIGLTICRKVVERHKGKIWVASTPGVGSTFYFTLKRAPESIDQ